MIFEVDDEAVLPLAVWRYLVKLRAGWLCEECGAALELAGHHKNGRGREHGGDHRLANGRALCHSCHGKEHCSTDDPLHQRGVKVARVACEECGKRVSVRNLDQHQRLVHRPEKVDCPECGKSVHKAMLEQHRRFVHGEAPLGRGGVGVGKGTGAWKGRPSEAEARVTR